jgi:2-polyprenyl-6-methoxyphenol hydroxylase-like FAD-dependent oxidoreductase
VGSDHRYDPVEGRLQRLRDRFAHFGSPVADYLDALRDDDQIHCSALERLECGQWCTDRVVLIGDAAHATSPMLGQGGSLAMEDALVLARSLAHACPIRAGLATYCTARRRRVQWVLEQSRAVGEAFARHPRERDAMLQAHGEEMLHGRLRPLTEDVDDGAS